MRNIEITIPKSKDIDLDIGKSTHINLDMAGSKGTGNYNALTNKPSINGITLIGDKESPELKLQGLMDEITAQEIDIIIFGG